YPAQFGRFCGNMKGLLDGVDVRAIFAPDEKRQDQGYARQGDPEAFLESIDACLLWGLDDGAAPLLLRAARRKRNPVFIDLLDPGDPFYLLASKPYVFADAMRLEDSREVLAGLNIDASALSKNFNRSPETERRLRAAAPLVWRGRGDAWRPVMDQILRHGQAFSFCPVGGRPAATDQSFPVAGPDFGGVVFYRFVCGEGVYGLYAPQGEFIARNHLGYEPGLDKAFAPKRYARTADDFKRLCLYYPQAVAAYLAGETPRELTALTGVINQYGEHLNWEATALSRLEKSRVLGGRIKRVLAARHDPYDLAKLFRGVEVVSAVAASEERAAAETFRRALGGNALCFLASDLSPVTDAFARRLLRISRQKCPAGFLARAAAFRKRHSLVLWISLRSRRRAWRGQVEGYPEVIRALFTRHPGLGVIFDGAPSWERETLAGIRERLPRELDVFDATALALHESVVCVHLADFCIIAYGNGLTFPNIANLPGILHGPRKIMGLAPDVTQPVPFAPIARENAAGWVCAPPVNEQDEADYLNAGNYDLDVPVLTELALDLAGKVE
ncbi:MAG: hypothetical protein HQK82_13250, partial [Desulfovibrionaceae bacterium]|nr:hypothetical protein [Desulfovibrionaceae bacterium]